MTSNFSVLVSFWLNAECHCQLLDEYNIIHIRSFFHRIMGNPMNKAEELRLVPIWKIFDKKSMKKKKTTFNQAIWVSFLMYSFPSPVMDRKQGRVYGYPSRMRVGRGCIWGHLIIWTGVVVRPKTAEKPNKAGYTATLVACAWAGAVIHKIILAGAVKPKIPKKNKKKVWRTDRKMDQQTNKV